MERKLAILSIGAALLLILSFFPSAAIEIPKEDVISNIDTSESKEIFEEPQTDQYYLYHLKGDKTYDKTLIELTVEESEAMWEELRSIESGDSTTIEIYESKLEIMKNYNIIPDDLELENIVNVDNLGDNNGQVESKAFTSESALVLFVGGGLGFGLGVPFFVTTGVFLAALLGFGYVLVYEIYTTVSHTLTTFFFIPLLIGLLIGFTGLLLLPVIPGFLYSNFLGLGITAFTHWGLYPAGNQTSSSTSTMLKALSDRLKFK